MQKHFLNSKTIAFSFILAFNNQIQANLCDDIENPSILYQRSESFLIQSNHEKAIEALENACLLLSADDSNDKDELRLLCLYKLFLIYAANNDYELMTLTAQKFHFQILKKMEYLGIKNLNNEHFYHIDLCSDRPDPPDYERGGCVYEREAQEHYERALDCAMDAISHSITAGIMAYVPVYAAIEVYKAVESIKEAAVEYNRGVELEKQAGKR